MKKLILALVALTCVPAHADRAAEIYKEGMVAVDQGNVKAAQLAFREVLRLQPNHPHARFQLGELQRNQGSVAARARERKLAEFEIAQINFDKTELSEALEALTMLVEKKSEGKFSPNFMIQDPADKFADSSVTLTVKNLPAKAAFNMILQQAGAVAKYEEHAIIVKPVARTGSR